MKMIKIYLVTFQWFNNQRRSANVRLHLLTLILWQKNNQKIKTKTSKIGSRDVSRQRLESREPRLWEIVSAMMWLRWRRNGSTLAEFVLSCSRTSPQNVDDATLLTAVNSSLVDALNSSAYQRFYDVLNASVTLHSLRIYHYDTASSSSQPTTATVTTRTVNGSTAQPVTSSPTANMTSNTTSLPDVEQQLNNSTTTVNDTVVVGSLQSNATVPTTTTSISIPTSSTTTIRSSASTTTTSSITSSTITISNTTDRSYNLTTSWSVAQDNTTTKTNSNTSAIA